MGERERKKFLQCAKKVLTLARVVFGNRADAQNVGRKQVFRINSFCVSAGCFCVFFVVFVTRTFVEAGLRGLDGHETTRCGSSASVSSVNPSSSISRSSRLKCFSPRTSAEERISIRGGGSCLGNLFERSFSVADD